MRPWAKTIDVVDVLNQGTQKLILAPRSDKLRTPAVNLLDLRIEKEMTLGGQFGLDFLLDIFNVFNDDAYYDVGSVLVTSDAFNVGSKFVPPRRAMIGMKLTF